MSDKVNPTPGDSSDEQKNHSGQQRGDTLRRRVSEAARKGRQAGWQTARSAAQSTYTAVGKAQRKLGENYYDILAENPLVSNTLSRADLLTQDKELLSTVYNIPWITTLFWTAGAGSAVTLQRPIAREAKRLVHDRGHIKRWDAINKFMDSASSSGHRLRFGHSIEYLPQIVQEHGIEAVPAFFIHLLQDFTTPAGIPIVPHSWEAKDILQSYGLPPRTATNLVSLNFSRLLADLAGPAKAKILYELWAFGKSIHKTYKMQHYLKTATDAMANRDYDAAVANYRCALDLDRSPLILMSLGRVYMQRASHRLRAHQSFAEAVTLLADQPDATVPYYHAKLSVRGLERVMNSGENRISMRFSPVGPVPSGLRFPHS